MTMKRYAALTDSLAPAPHAAADTGLSSGTLREPTSVPDHCTQAR